MDHLIKYKERSGKSTRQLAQDCGLSSGYLSDLMSGNRTPSLAIALKIQDGTGGAVKVAFWAHFSEIADAVHCSLHANERVNVKEQGVENVGSSKENLTQGDAA